MKLTMAMRHQSDGNIVEAIRLFQQVLVKEPDNLQANLQLGILYNKLRREGLARPLLEKAVSIDPKHLTARLKLAMVLHDLGRTPAACALLEPALEQAKLNVDEMLNLATTYTRLGQLHRAEQVYLIALELDDSRFELHNNLGTFYRDLGKMDLARKHYKTALELNINCASAHLSLANMNKNIAGSPEIMQIEALYKNPKNLSPEEKVMVTYGLAKATEDIKQFDAAFDLYLEANELEGQIRPYNAEATHQKFERIRKVYSRDFFLDHTRIGSKSKFPIFIVGMPRSGTSLTEQILASHPDVFGCGELDDINSLTLKIKSLTSEIYPLGIKKLSRPMLSKMASIYITKVKTMSQGARRATDKMPHNFLNIGLITLLFPNAKIIHCKRNPMDTALSIFRQKFSGDHPYSHTLTGLGDYYRHYQSLMAHWHNVLPFRIYDVEYESLIENTEEEIRALLKFCDLPFNSKCLHFNETERPVATASHSQVRQPIYTSSVSAWRRYEKQMQPFVDALGSWEERPL